MNNRCLVVTALAFASLGDWSARCRLAASDHDAAEARTQDAVNGESWTPDSRTAWGDPDLQGIWSVGYIVTPLERPERFAAKEFLTDEDVAALEREAAATFGVGAGAGRGLARPERGTDADLSGAYNDVFAGKGSRVVATKRSSLIVDPANGRIPPLTPEGRKRAAAVKRINSPIADNPEDRADDDRCLGITLPVAFGHPATAGAYSRIVQSPEAITIYYEQNRGGAYRTFYLDERSHLPANVRQWLGDSIARWEGQTLIVDTTNFTDMTIYQGSTDNLHLVEWFTRVAADVIKYEVTIDDPTTFTSPWTIEVPLMKGDEERNQIFEDACNEGNYALMNILSGARAVERDGTRKAQAGE